MRKVSSKDSQTNNSPAEDSLRLPVLHNSTTAAPSVASVRRVQPNVTLVLLLAHQRVGSSFTGTLVDQAANTFYVYEPIASVYMHLYGLHTHMAVPSDIHYYRNTTER